MSAISPQRIVVGEISFLSNVVTYNQISGVAFSIKPSLLQAEIVFMLFCA